MAKIIIDTDVNYEDVENQVMEMSTGQLLDVYDLFERNPTVFTMVANELIHRREHETQLEHQAQIGEIERRMTR